MTIPNSKRLQSQSTGVQTAYLFDPSNHVLTETPSFMAFSCPCVIIVEVGNINHRPTTASLPFYSYVAECSLFQLADAALFDVHFLLAGWACDMKEDKKDPSYGT